MEKFTVHLSKGGETQGALLPQSPKSTERLMLFLADTFNIGPCILQVQWEESLPSLCLAGLPSDNTFQLLMEAGRETLAPSLFNPDVVAESYGSNSFVNHLNVVMLTTLKHVWIAIRQPTRTRMTMSRLYGAMADAEIFKTQLIVSNVTETGSSLSSCPWNLSRCLCGHAGLLGESMLRVEGCSKHLMMLLRLC